MSVTQVVSFARVCMCFLCAELLSPRVCMCFLCVELLSPRVCAWVCAVGSPFALELPI